MELVTIPLLLGLVLVLVPLLVRIAGRNAGWPLALSFLALSIPLFQRLGSILHGTVWEWSTIWMKGILPLRTSVAPDGSAADSLASGSATAASHAAANAANAASATTAAATAAATDAASHAAANAASATTAAATDAASHAAATAAATNTPATGTPTTTPTLLHGDVVLALRGDALSVTFALLALLIGAAVFIYSTRYLHKGSGAMSFYLLMTAFMGAVVTLVLADDIVLAFCAWELVSLASFFLIARSGPAGERGSLRTIILTFVGGLTLVTAMGIMTAVTDTTRISEIITSDAWTRHPKLLAVTAVLVAVSGFTKAAQFPFHFWLPEAMAAETPVSAFLHAAAVVKAGIYLLLRFSPLFHDLLLWRAGLIIIGMGTAIMGALFALQKTDLKKLTAYSTVSQLGWIVCTIGIGTPAAMVAAVVHTLAHALFKSSLFMLIGVVDHQTGTRDIRHLGSIWRRMPITFTCAAIAVTSMAAVPPLFGFVSKESMLTAMWDGLPTTAGTLLLIAAGLGAILTFAYSYRYLFGGFVDGTRDMSHVREARPSLWLPAALPGLLSLPLGLVPGVLDHLVGAAGSVALYGLVPVETDDSAAHAAEPIHAHLALWHGFTVPLLVSVVVIVVGVVAVLRRQAIARAIGEREFFPTTGAHALQVAIHAGSRFGRLGNRMADSVSPARHLAMPVLVVIALAGAVTLQSITHNGGVDGVSAPRMGNLDRPLDYVALLMVVLGVASTTTARRRLSAIIGVSAVGVGVTLQVLTLGAPDVALTQLLVEILTTVVTMLVVRLQPRLFTRRSPRRDKLAAVIAVLAGVATTGGVLALIGHHGKPELAQWYLANGPDISHGKNVVNTILVEFRALDTMGELSVLGMCGVAIAAVVASVPRQRRDVRGILAPMMRPSLNSIPLRWLATMMIPVLILLSAAIFWRGHNHPGGGFIAALIGGGALMMAYLAKPRDPDVGNTVSGTDGTAATSGETSDVGHTAPSADAPTPTTTPRWPFALVSAGICFAIIAGILGHLAIRTGGHGSFLEPINGHIGPEFVTTAQIFDAGVYLAVLGLVAIALTILGGPRRPGAEHPTGPTRVEGGLAPLAEPADTAVPSAPPGAASGRQHVRWGRLGRAPRTPKGRTPQDTLEVD